MFEVVSVVSFVVALKVQAEINSLRLTDIAFDAKTLRVIAAAEGSISAMVSKLPEL